jgi:hypothetical protein
MNFTGVQVATKVADHLTAYFAGNPNVSVTRDYFPIAERGDYAKGEFKINVWPLGISSNVAGRGRNAFSRILSRTIGVGIVSRGEMVLDANKNEVHDQSKMDDFILFVEDVMNEVNAVDEITVDEIEDADYLDPITLEAERLLSTVVNVTYKDS